MLLSFSLARRCAWLSLGSLSLGAVASCSVEQGEAGAACVRSTECAAGLVCIESVCSDDLSSIADPGEVPMLMPEADEEPPVDAGTVNADAAAEPEPASPDGG